MMGSLAPSELGMLNGKFKHASIALYWQRIKGEN